MASALTLLLPEDFQQLYIIESPASTPILHGINFSLCSINSTLDWAIFNNVGVNRVCKIY